MDRQPGMVVGRGRMRLDVVGSAFLRRIGERRQARADGQQPRRHAPGGPGHPVRHAPYDQRAEQHRRRGHPVRDALRADEPGGAGSVLERFLRCVDPRDVRRHEPDEAVAVREQFLLVDPLRGRPVDEARRARSGIQRPDVDDSHHDRAAVGPCGPVPFQQHADGNRTRRAVEDRKPGDAVHRFQRPPGSPSGGGLPSGNPGVLGRLRRDSMHMLHDMLQQQFRLSRRVAPAI
mmetsp:Transcript_12690/g.29992  ORF Transcript_12690/g.29992 Transcript_12690/m.29992 type:complete len:233 (+) Transcript_12690:725-1423(+)